MPQRVTLIKIEKITDCDTGMYQIGELDFGISCGLVEDYLKSYGLNGKKELLAMLGHLAYHVERYWQELPREQAQTEQMKTTGGEGVKDE